MGRYVYEVRLGADLSRLRVTLERSEAILILTGLSIVGYLCLLVYNAYFHPLAKFPGPRLAGATRWYESYFDLLVRPGGQFMYETNRIHEEYGPIVRIGPNEVHIDDPKYLDTLYGQGHKRNKVPYMIKIFATSLSIFGTEKHDLHRSRRVVLTPFFSRKTVQKLDPLVRGKVDKMCDLMHEHYLADKDIIIRRAMTATIVDVTSEYSFRKCANALDDADFSPHWADMIAGVTELAPVARQFPGIVEFMQKLPIWVVRMLDPLVAAYNEYELMVRHQIEIIFEQYKNGTLQDHKSSDGGVSTVFHEILESSLPEAEKTVPRMTQEALSVIAAASETTSNTLATTVFFLASKPEYAKRLHEELKTIMPQPKSFTTWKELEKLPFLHAVVKEGLRVTAPVCGRLPLVAPDENLKYKDWVIPSGTYIGMSHIDALHSAEIYPSPHEFLPDRWLTATPEHLKRMDAAFVPFGRGPRMCIGFSLAYANLYHLIGTVFRRFELEPVDTIRERDVDVARDHFVSKPSMAAQGIKVRIVKEY